MHSRSPLPTHAKKPTRQHMPRSASLAGLPLLCYEQLLDAQVERLGGFEWPELDENTPCGLCYTSGAGCAG